MVKSNPYTKERVLEFLTPIAELLTESQKEELANVVEVESNKKDWVLYNEGDHPFHLYFLVDGKVKVSRIGVGGRSLILRIITNGGLFGYRSYFAQQRHITTATATAKTSLYRIPLSIIEKWKRENVQLANFFVSELAVDLGRSDERLLNMTQKHVRGRLAEALLTLVAHFGFEKDGQTIASRPSRDELASIGNMTSANAIRTLSTFADEGIVSVDGRAIRILNMKELELNSKLG